MSSRPRFANTQPSLHELGVKMRALSTYALLERIEVKRKFNQKPGPKTPDRTQQQWLEEIVTWAVAGDLHNLYDELDCNDDGYYEKGRKIMRKFNNNKDYPCTESVLTQLYWIIKRAEASSSNNESAAPKRVRQREKPSPCPHCPSNSGKLAGHVGRHLGSNEATALSRALIATGTVIRKKYLMTSGEFEWFEGIITSHANGNKYTVQYCDGDSTSEDLAPLDRGQTSGWYVVPDAPLLCDTHTSTQKWTPSNQERITFFNKIFKTGNYRAVVSNDTFNGYAHHPEKNDRLTYRLKGATRRKNRILFHAQWEPPNDQKDELWEGEIAPSQLLYSTSELIGPKYTLPPIIADDWADQRSNLFARYAKSKHTNGFKCVVLDGRGRNTLALRSHGIPEDDIYNIDMDPALVVWQKIHGMNAIYSAAYLRKIGDPGYIENSILFQQRNKSLSELYQNTVAVYFDFYGCKDGLLEDVFTKLDLLLPKLKVVGVAQFTKRLCEDITSMELGIERLPGWGKEFDETHRSMRCRFYVKQ